MGSMAYCPYINEFAMMSAFGRCAKLDIITWNGCTIINSANHHQRQVQCCRHRDWQSRPVMPQAHHVCGVQVEEGTKVRLLREMIIVEGLEEVVMSVYLVGGHGCHVGFTPRHLVNNIDYVTEFIPQPIPCTITMSTLIIYCRIK